MVVRESFFNELCLLSPREDRSVLLHLGEMYSELKKNNFSVCRVSAEHKESVLNYLKRIPGASPCTISNFAYSFFRPPFERPNLTEQQENNFLEMSCSYKNKPVVGLAWAAYYDTLALSLSVSDEWDTSAVTIARDSLPCDVRHISKAEHLQAHTDWIQGLEEPTVCKIPPGNKHFHVRDDHGKKELKDFWEKLSKNEYVVSCLNSLPFNKSQKNFIKAVYPDGKIELVLVWEDKGYGLVIQTTGNGMAQTQRIADILDKEFGLK